MTNEETAFLREKLAEANLLILHVAYNIMRGTDPIETANILIDYLNRNDMETVLKTVGETKA